MKFLSEIAYVYEKSKYVDLRGYVRYGKRYGPNWRPLTRKTIHRLIRNAGSKLTSDMLRLVSRLWLGASSYRHNWNRGVFDDVPTCALCSPPRSNQ